MKRGMSKSKDVTKCSICNATFASRNRLFQHLRVEHASEWNGISSSGSSSLAKPKRAKIAIQFGYDAEELMSLATDSNTAHQNTSAAQLVLDAFVRIAVSASAHLSCVPNMTISSDATERHLILSQEKGCSAASDVAVVEYSLNNNNVLDLNTANLADTMNRDLMNCGYSKAIQILAIAPCALRSKIHAEKSVTQRIYHYLLPMSWLDGGKEASLWYVRTGRVRIASIESTSSGWSTNDTAEPTPPAVTRLKTALKGIESQTKSQSAVGASSLHGSIDDDGGVNSGRFAALGSRRPQSFHNFVPDYTKQTPLGPKGSAALWQTIDRAKVVDLIPDDSISSNLDDCPDIVSVLEIRGDNFILEQVRRLITEVVAVVNGWTPQDFHQIATHQRIANLEIPPAPSGRLYYADQKYSFYEQSFGSLFPGSESTERKTCWLETLQLRILQRRKQDCTSSTAEKAWLEALETVDCPILRAQVQEAKSRIMADQQQTNCGVGPTKKTDATLHSSTGVATIVEPPSIYRPTLDMLCDIVQRGEWPPTPTCRTRIIRSPMDITKTTSAEGCGRRHSSYLGQDYQSGSFVLVNGTVSSGQTFGNKKFPDLAKAVFELEAQLKIQNGWMRNAPSTHCAINRNASYVPHCDNGSGKEQSKMIIVAMANFDGGELIIEGSSHAIQYKPLQYDGWTCRHWTAPFVGERFTLNWFSPAPRSEEEEHRSNVADDKERREDIRAKYLAHVHDALLPGYPPLSFRVGSTDSLVVNEILDTESGGAYSFREGDFEFSVQGHTKILDVGAHIGVFTRYALSLGATRVTAYEPEPTNAKLLQQNTTPLMGHSKTTGAVEIYTSAVAHGAASVQELICDNDSQNTWRHSLEVYSRQTTTPKGVTQEDTFTRYQVETIPFFGKALQPGMTFVKIDAEGAEMDILLSKEASDPASWLDVSHLVFEWSFVKEKRVNIFHQAMQNLRTAGFEIKYDGQGAWWDTESHVLWPYHNDMVVFAIR